METVNAKVVENDDKYFILINIEDQNIKIPISEDKPNDVKDAFNKLIQRIKQGEFSIELETEEKNLFDHVAKEYISQLNSEIEEVYSEMESYGLLDQSLEQN